MSKYPSLTLPVLEHLLPLKEQMDVEAGWLDKADCPYKPEIKELLVKLFATREDSVILREANGVGSKKRGRPLKNGEISDDQAEIIEQEAMGLLRELKELKAPTGKGMDHDTKIQIIKAKTSLIEKVVNIQERAYNVRKVSVFQKIIIDILADLVDPDKIAEFQKRLGVHL